MYIETRVSLHLGDTIYVVDKTKLTLTTIRLETYDAIQPYRGENILQIPYQCFYPKHRFDSNPSHNNYGHRYDFTKCAFIDKDLAQQYLNNLKSTNDEL